MSVAGRVTAILWHMQVTQTLCWVQLIINFLYKLLRNVTTHMKRY